MKGGGKALWKDENIADSITTHAINFIREHKDEPFFMYFATNDVHVPRFPHERFRGKNPMGLRGDAIVQFDWSVGQILETLDKLGLSENTLIIRFQVITVLLWMMVIRIVQRSCSTGTVRQVRCVATNIVLSKVEPVFPPLCAGLRKLLSAGVGCIGFTNRLAGLFSFLG